MPHKRPCPVTASRYARCAFDVFFSTQTGLCEKGVNVLVFTIRNCLRHCFARNRFSKSGSAILPNHVFILYENERLYCKIQYIVAVAFGHGVCVGKNRVVSRCRRIELTLAWASLLKTLGFLTVRAWNHTCGKRCACSCC